MQKASIDPGRWSFVSRAGQLSIAGGASLGGGELLARDILMSERLAASRVRLSSYAAPRDPRLQGM